MTDVENDTVVTSRKNVKTLLLLAKEVYFEVENDEYDRLLDSLVDRLINCDD